MDSSCMHTDAGGAFHVRLSGSPCVHYSGALSVAACLMFSSYARSCDDAVVMGPCDLVVVVHIPLDLHMLLVVTVAVNLKQPLLVFHL